MLYITDSCRSSYSLSLFEFFNRCWRVEHLVPTMTNPMTNLSLQPQVIPMHFLLRVLKRKKSEVWDHFSMMGDCDPNNPRASCNYCGKDYGCRGKRDGTSNLWNHLYNQCPTHFKSNEYS